MEIKDELKEILINNAVSWRKKEGDDMAYIYVDDFLNEVIGKFKLLPIHGVVASVLCVSDTSDCLNLTKGKKYTLIESDGAFFRVINDLGNEQLYYNYRFKRL